MRKPIVQKTVRFYINSLHIINTQLSSIRFQLDEFHVNIAVRAETSSNSQTSSSAHLMGLPVFWNEATANPAMDWDKLLDLFRVAMMAKYSISITELTREANQQNPSLCPSMVNLDEDPAQGTLSM